MPGLSPHAPPERGQVRRPLSVISAASPSETGVLRRAPTSFTPCRSCLPQGAILFLETSFNRRTIINMNESVNADLRQLHHDVMAIYNRETCAIQARPTATGSINVTNYLAGQAIKFGDAALVLLEDKNQPLDVPAALLRTCLEAQARANHIIGVAGNDRETRAQELIHLMSISHEYYEKQCIQMSKDTIPDESKLLPRDRPYFAAMKKHLFSVDTSDLKKIKKEYEELNRKWTYGKVIEKDKFSDPIAMQRSEAQRLQPSLHLAYIQCCAFVHTDPAAIKHGERMTKISVVYSIVLAEVLAVVCFFKALDKDSDPDLVIIKKRIIDFDINEKILPKEGLPTQ